MRLLVALFGCIFLGSLALTVARFDPATARVSPLMFYSVAGGAALALAVAVASVARPWALETFKTRAFVLLACVYAGLILTSVAQHDSGTGNLPPSVQGMVISILCFQGALIPLAWVFVRQHGIGLREGFGFNLRPGYAVLLGAVAALGFIPVGMGLQSGCAALANHFHIELPMQEAVMILHLADSWPKVAMLGMTAIVIAPIAEETLFRGILYTTLKGFGYPRAAVWITSLVFAAIHFNALAFVPLVVLALVLTWLYEKTGNLLACIACHATFNAVNFVLLFVTNSADHSLRIQP